MIQRVKVHLKYAMIYNCTKLEVIGKKVSHSVFRTYREHTDSTSSLLKNIVTLSYYFVESYATTIQCQVERYLTLT
jgi:hypothetical protein